MKPIFKWNGMFSTEVFDKNFDANTTLLEAIKSFAKTEGKINHIDRIEISMESIVDTKRVSTSSLSKETLELFESEKDDGTSYIVAKYKSQSSLLDS